MLSKCVTGLRLLLRRGLSGSASAKKLLVSFGYGRHACLLEALNELSEGIVILDASGRYVAWNKRYAEMYPNTVDLVKVGGRLEDAVRAGIARGDYPEAQGREEAWLAERLERLSAPGPGYEQIMSDGRHILIEDRRISGGGLVSLRVDVTAIKRREASFRLLFENNPLPMLVCDSANWQIMAANHKACALYGYDKDAFPGMPFAAIHSAVKPHELPHSCEEFDTLPGKSFLHVGSKGNLLEVELSVSVTDFAEKPAFLVAIVDITERRVNERHINHLARHDALTNLPNRINLVERMQSAIETVSADAPAALLFLDLDRFKIINDTLGHSVGDALLKQVAIRLRSCLRDGDTVARLGGDEFAIWLCKDCSRLEVAMVASRILSEMRRPMRVDDRDLHVGASIGIAMVPENGDGAEEIFRCADSAMYAAKHQGRGDYRFFDVELDNRMQARNGMEADLKVAITGAQLEVHYQPLISLSGGHITCMEALVRWRHPKRGLVSPGEFIPIAEETGMIRDIGRWVLRKACQDIAMHRNRVKVAVNVSPVELTDENFLDYVRLVLQETGLDPALLQLEITETAVMSNVETTIALLSKVQALGVGIAMDDFGTGYSSLCSLRTFPFNKVKIDRAFVRDASTSRDGHEVLSAIVGLVKALGMVTTAEGVETELQGRIVSELACDEMQGFLFSPALPIGELEALFNKSAA